MNARIERMTFENRLTKSLILAAGVLVALTILGLWIAVQGAMHTQTAEGLEELVGVTMVRNQVNNNPELALSVYKRFSTAKKSVDWWIPSIKAEKEDRALIRAARDERLLIRRQKLLDYLIMACEHFADEYNTETLTVNTRLLSNPKEFFTDLIDGKAATPLPTFYSFAECR